jgi:hypothetical protein
MALNKEVTNADLRTHVGFGLDGEPRKRLNELKLVSSAKRGRAYWHELTDDGWAWCRDQLTEPAPTTRDSGLRCLYVVMHSFRPHLEREDLQLADVFGPPVEVRLEDRIRSAYRRLTEEPGDWVSLTKVRQLLDGVPAAEVDDVLRRLGREPDVHLVPETDQRRLTPEDRAAAVRIGGKDNHLIKVDQL